MAAVTQQTPWARAGSSPAGPSTAPGLDELADHPERVRELEPGAVETLLIRHAAVGQVLLGRLLVARTDNHRTDDGAPADLLTVKQAAERVNVPPSWIRTAIKAGRLPSKKLGVYRRIHPDDLERFIVDHPADP